MSSSYETSFGSSNQGFQLGINKGTINTGETYHITERSEVYNTEGGAVFSGNISASRDVNITHINTIRPIAQSLYSSLFTSSEIFSQVRNEIGLLVTVLNATEEHAKKAHAESFCSSELKEALDNCKDALSELSKLKEHFDSVGAQTQVTWERMDWSKTKLADIKSNLSLYIQVLNTLIARMMLSSQSNVERMLKTLVNERRDGKHNSPALSIISNGSLAPDEKEQWRQLRKELQGVGITPEIFSLNREYILEYLGSFSQSESNTADHLETIEEDVAVPDEFLEHDHGTDRDPFFRDDNVMARRVDPPLTIADYAEAGLIVPANAATPNPNFNPLSPGEVVYKYTDLFPVDDFPMNTEDTSLENPSQDAEETSEFPQHEQQSSWRGRRETLVSHFSPPRHILGHNLTEEGMLDPGDEPSLTGDFRLYHDTNAPQPPSQAQVFGPEFTSKEIPDSGDASYQSGDFQLYDNTNIILHTSSQDIYQPTSGRRGGLPPRSTPRSYFTTQHAQIEYSDTSKNSYPKRNASLLFGYFDTGEINPNDLSGPQNQPDFTNEMYQSFPLESTNNSSSASGPVEDISTAIDIYYSNPLDPRIIRNSTLSNPTSNTQNFDPNDPIWMRNSPDYTLPPSRPPNRSQPRMIYDAANRRQRNSNRSRRVANPRPLGAAQTRGISDSQRRRYTSASSTAANFDEPSSSDSVNASTRDRTNYHIVTNSGTYHSEDLRRNGHNMADPLPNHHHNHISQVQL